MDLRIIKKDLRAAMRAKRQQAHDQNPRAAQELCTHFMSLLDNVAARGVIALYHAIETEIDTGPLAIALQSAGYRLCLPVIQGPNTKLIFRAYAPGDKLEKGQMQVPEPLATQEELVPDLLCSPLLAFDKRGHRLGYGGGYYDRTLAALRHQGRRPRCIGIAFAAQEIEHVPTGLHDQPLDVIVTEQAVRVPDAAAL